MVHSGIIAHKAPSDNRRMDTPWYIVAKARLEARDDLNITSLAERLGIGRSGLGHYLAGRREPSTAMLRKIAKELGVSVSELVENDPTYARDEIEHKVLDALRELPDDKRTDALAILEALAAQHKTLPND
jgi:transcriptional regulator with XRE-family HTH domain